MSRAQTRQQWRAHFRGDPAARPDVRVALGARTQGSVPSAEQKAKSTPPGLWIQINHLELRGVGRLEEEQVAAALQSELKSLIAAKGAPRGWGRDQSLERVDAARPSDATRVSAQWLGTQVGRAIYNLRSTERR